jgi:hypothetical protein
MEDTDTCAPELACGFIGARPLLALLELELEVSGAAVNQARASTRKEEFARIDSEANEGSVVRDII